MEFESKSLLVVGGVPEPIGGVTTYIYRLARSEKDKIKAVFDLYPAEIKKDISPVRLVSPSRLPLLSLFFHLFIVKDDVYFNFSGALGLRVLLVLPKRRGVQWFLTLHNGAINKRLKRSKVIRFLAALGVRRVDKVGYLSPTQRHVYESLGVKRSDLLQVSSFIPINLSDIEPIDVDRFSKISSFLEENAPYFVISGYPTKIYQHLEVLKVFESLWEKGEKIKLVAFWYGDDSDGILETLKERFRDNENAQFYWGVDADSFLSVLAQSAGYIRMNTVDSFGVAVAEAVTFGIPVIATNVCSRYNGARIVEVGDFEALSDFILQCNNANRVCQ